MASRRPLTLWEAKPHTIAIFTILEGYLQAWFQIFGRRAIGRDLLYVDGFVGPGRYTNHSTGSPIAALRSASTAIASAGRAWKAGDVYFAFIEPVPAIHAHLTQHFEPFSQNPWFQIQILQSSFVEGIETLKGQWLDAFGDLFAFIDPFGATGVPFTTVADILSRQ